MQKNHSSLLVSRVLLIECSLSHVWKVLLSVLKTIISYFSYFRECKVQWIRLFLHCNKVILWAWTLCTPDPCLQVEHLHLEVFRMACQICRLHQMQVDPKCILRVGHITGHKLDKCQWCQGIIPTRYGREVCCFCELLIVGIYGKSY